MHTIPIGPVVQAWSHVRWRCTHQYPEAQPAYQWHSLFPVAGFSVNALPRNADRGPTDPDKWGRLQSAASWVIGGLVLPMGDGCGATTTCNASTGPWASATHAQPSRFGEGQCVTLLLEVVVPPEAIEAAERYIADCGVRDVLNRFVTDLVHERPPDVQQFMVGWAAIARRDAGGVPGPDGRWASPPSGSGGAWECAADYVLREAASYVRASLARRLDEGLLQPASRPVALYPPTYHPPLSFAALEEFLMGLTRPTGDGAAFDARVMGSLVADARGFVDARGYAEPQKARAAAVYAYTYELYDAPPQWGIVAGSPPTPCSAPPPLPHSAFSSGHMSFLFPPVKRRCCPTAVGHPPTAVEQPHRQGQGAVGLPQCTTAQPLRRRWLPKCPAIVCPGAELASGRSDFFDF